MKKSGTVYLVGAGPGDVGLLTVRGAELLARAEVVIYDALVNPALLRLAPPTAEIIFGGKRGHVKTMPQAALNELLVRHAREGRTVVRLKGGDPYIFGRGGEEALALAEAHLPFEVVPGISSVEAAPNYAGIPLTHREHSSRLTVVTGHEDPAKPESRVNWAEVATIEGTKVVLMGTDRIGVIAQKLVAAGMPPRTPVAMVQWGTTGRQRSIAGTLATIADIAVASGIGPPTVAVIGDVVNLRDKLNWFERRPLFGRRIVVTRARDQAGALTALLGERGAEVLEIPVIRVTPPTDLRNLADALLELNSYDWLIFTSANGVQGFFDHFFKAFDDLREIGGVKIAAIGPATAAKVREYRLKVDLMPAEALGVKMAAAFLKFESIENLKMLLARAEAANHELPQALEEEGAIVDDVAFYRTVTETEAAADEAARLRADGADWITFTSGSTVEGFHARFDLPALVNQFPRLKLASIGPETTKAITALGLKPAVEAKAHTMEGLAAAVEKACAKESQAPGFMKVD